MGLRLRRSATTTSTMLSQGRPSSKERLKWLCASRFILAAFQGTLTGTIKGALGSTVRSTLKGADSEAHTQRCTLRNTAKAACTCMLNSAPRVTIKGRLRGTLSGLSKNMLRTKPKGHSKGRSGRLTEGKLGGTLGVSSQGPHKRSKAASSVGQGDFPESRGRFLSSH